MLSRRAMLALSIVLALAFHGLLFAVAPRVPILRAHSDVQEILSRFRIRLREPEEQAPVEEETEAKRRLDTRPGRVEDLLERDFEELALEDSLLDKEVELSQLADRLATEELQREYDLSQDVGGAQKVDAKIIEIAQEDARKDIEVARWFVRPSPSRILGPNEFPTLRTPDADDRAAEGMLEAPATRSSLGKPAEPPSSITTAKVEPAYEEGVLEPEVLQPSAPPLPLEHKVIHAPTVEEIRQESTYEFLDDLVDIKLDAYVPLGEDKGYFRLQITPKEDKAIEVLPKDVTFIVDASNSIPQHKLNITAKGIKEMVGMLRPEDRFNIVVFRDSATHYRPESVPATAENKQQALEFLSALESRGQTDVYEAIRPVLEAPPRFGIPGIVLVMTDGRPTTGVRDARAIINALTAENVNGNTIFAYGGGNTVDEYLLDLLALRNKGESYVSRRLTDIDRDLPLFFEQLREPILVALNADYGRIAEDKVFPREIPDFYRGRAVTVYGRFDPASDNEFSMRLTGLAQDHEKELVFKKNLTEAATGDKGIARDWAKKKIYHLIGEMCRMGETPELLGELRRLGRKYGIKTSYDD